MNTWQDQKIGTRLGVVFGAILLCVIVVGGFGLTWLGRLNSEMAASIQKRYNTVELTRQTIEHSITNARITFQLFETTDPDQEKKLNVQNDAISAGNRHPGCRNPKDSQLYPGARAFRSRHP